MSRRKLTPESPDWWRIEKALADRRQEIDSPVLAAADFNLALRAGKLKTMRRHADGSCEPLAVSAWDDLYIAPLIRVNFNSPTGRSRMRPGELVVWSRKLGGQIRGQWVFVWRPDYKKIFSGAATPSARSRAQPPEVLETRGRKKVHDRADLQAAALGLALQRKLGASEKTQTAVVDELRDWCRRNKQKVPGNSYLNEVVADAFRIKLTLKS
jgi:hypothetical protein